MRAVRRGVRGGVVLGPEVSADTDFQEREVPKQAFNTAYVCF